MAEKNILARTIAAKRALALATSVDEIKDVRDKAEALRLYSKQAGYGLEMQNQCAEIKIRAERRGGEILIEMKERGERKGGHGGDRQSSSTKELEDVGVSKKQSHRWQRIASVPEDEFEAHVEATKVGGKELTSAGVLNVAKKKDQEAKRGQVSKSKKPQPLPTGVFDLLYADPPWRYEHDTTPSRAIENQYPTMTLDAICDLAVPAAANCVLFLWATAPKLEEALRVLNAWGFTYRTNAVWDKQKIGMGYWFRGQHELLLVGVKGKVAPPHEHDRVSSVLSYPRGKHSVKPVAIYELLEKLYPKATKLEMFNRSKRKGWKTWGNE